MSWGFEKTLLDIRNPFPNLVVKITFLEVDAIGEMKLLLFSLDKDKVII